MSESRDTPAGVVYGVAAYAWWGLMPIYFRAIEAVPPPEILAHRIVYSAISLTILVALLGRFRELRRALADRHTRLCLMASTVLIAINWYVYIYAVGTRQTLQATLGYFINPLLNVLLGAVIFRERLRPLQWLAIALAVIGMLAVVQAAGTLPWIALTLAFSFGLYGTVRKQTRIDGTLGLYAETLFLGPLMLGYLIWLGFRDQLCFGKYGMTVDLLMLASAVITPLPMIFFGQAARKLRLATLGLLLYISPSLQFFVAVYALGEEMPPGRLRGFVIVWIALVIYVADTLYSLRASRVVVGIDAAITAVPSPCLTEPN